MKWGAIIGITLVIVLTISFEWSTLRKSPWKTKAAYAVLLLAGWGIAIALVHYPGMPGPTQVFLKAFKPLSSSMNLK